jgi:hypothetical protein
MVLFHRILLNGASTYHDGSVDEQVYGEYAERAQSISSGFGEFIIGFLIEWGSLARIFPRKGLSQLKEELDRWFLQHRRGISNLSETPLWKADLKELGFDICELFDSLRRIQQPSVNGRKRAFGSTAAGKTLHLLMPKLCVIWDEKTVRRNVGLDKDAWSYLRYLMAEKGILEKAIRDASRANHSNYEEAVRWIESAHRAQRENVAPFDFDEPITKILDEAMYDFGFVEEEVKPLLEMSA